MAALSPDVMTPTEAIQAFRVGSQVEREAMGMDKHQPLTGKPTEYTFPAEETQHRREMLRESLRVEQGGKKTAVGG